MTTPGLRLRRRRCRRRLPIATTTTSIVAVVVVFAAAVAATTKSTTFASAAFAFPPTVPSTTTTAAAFRSGAGVADPASSSAADVVSVRSRPIGRRQRFVPVATRLASSSSSSATAGRVDAPSAADDVDADAARNESSEEETDDDDDGGEPTPPPRKNGRTDGGGRSENAPPSSTSKLYRESRDMSGLGRWEYVSGNYILRPPVSDAPRALVHFLGGALVGAAPHVFYRYMLERLSDQGYLIVATPYDLSFDHLGTCDAIIGRFERVAPALARQYGPVPVVGMGHSCGALLQLLVTSLFPDTPRAANALLSFNNKPAKEAVPFFEELVAPAFTALAAKNETRPSSTDALNYGIELARAATEGRLPTDDLLRRVAKFLVPPPLANVVPTDRIVVPKNVRDALTNAVEGPAKALSDAGLLPLLNQAVDVAEQIPLLIEEVADGARDFVPPPSSVRAAARRAYRARRTLIVQYDDDPLDESETIKELLEDAEAVMRVKRPMVAFDVKFATLEGGHATPLLAPPVDIAERAEDLLGTEAARERLLYAQADATVDELVRWLEEGQL